MGIIFYHKITGNILTWDEWVALCKERKAITYGVVAPYANSYGFEQNLNDESTKVYEYIAMDVPIHEAFKMINIKYTFENTMIMHRQLQLSIKQAEAYGADCYGLNLLMDGIIEQLHIHQTFKYTYGKSLDEYADKLIKEDNYERKCK